MAKAVREATLVRDPSEDTGTTGKFFLKPSLHIYSMEPPDRGNKPEISRINPGKYRLEPWNSPHFGKCYRFVSVLGHVDVLLHKGNWGGDKALGLKSDTKGCVMVGNAIGELAGQKCILNSKDAFDRLMADLDGAPLDLTIT